MQLFRRRFGLRQALFLAAFCALVLTYKTYSDHWWMHHVIDVVIVEEHHEVLPYWYRAAWAGKLQLRHNTLLHIDAHSDMSPPQPTPHFPMFRPPDSIREVSNMMQRNDVFIVAAVISQLLSRVIWSWPSWDAASHASHSDFEHNILQVGTTTVRMSAEDESEEMAFCVCSSNRGGKECSIMNTTEPQDEPIIDEKDCAIKAKGVFEVIRDNATSAKLRRSSEWIPSPLFSSSSSSSFILDIDEDFFGTESPAQVLFRRARLQWKTIKRITEISSQLFCPNDVEAETASDKLVGSLIDTVVMDCKTSVGARDPGSPLRAKNSGACETVLQDVRSFVGAFLRRILSSSLSLLCSGDEPLLLRRIEELTRLFILLDGDQLKVLQQVGFCIKASPKTFFFERLTDLHTFGVCCGWNTPNDTVVTYHYPSTAEINGKLKQLQRTLASRNFPTPGIVTIARSMRDGYTSKPNFDLIEDGLLQVLQSVFPEKEMRVVYDEDLMSGRRGRRWNERIHPKPGGSWS